MLRRPESDDYGELGNVRMNLAAAHEGWCVILCIMPRVISL